MNICISVCTTKLLSHFVYSNIGRESRPLFVVIWFTVSLIFLTNYRGEEAGFSVIARIQTQSITTKQWGEIHLTTSKLVDINAIIKHSHIKLLKKSWKAHGLLVNITIYFVRECINMKTLRTYIIIYLQYNHYNFTSLCCFSFNLYLHILMQILFSIINIIEIYYKHGIYTNTQLIGKF